MLREHKEQCGDIAHRGGEHMTAQEEFDSTYITSSEIGKELGISRATIVQGRDRGLLPGAITVNGGQLTVWKREPLLPYLSAWKLTLQARRRELPA